ncbi:MAG: ABC transporter substrate-binding protein [Burkholderiaceae bacterium]
MSQQKPEHTRPFERRDFIKGAAAAAAVVAAPAIVRAAEKPIRIGVPSIFSGRVAILGESALDAIKMAAEEANAAGGIAGRMIEVVSRDSKGKPDEASRMVRDLANNEGCEIILNAEASGASFAVNEVVRDIKKFCIHSVSETSTLTADPKNRVPWAFRCARQGIHDAVGGGLYAARLANDEGLTRWATCSPDYAYGRANTSEFMEYAKLFAPKIEVIAETWPKIFQPDYTENVTALLNARPQALYTCLWGGDLVAFFDQAGLYGLFDQFKTVAVNLGDYPVIQAVKNLPGGVHAGSRYHKDVPDTEANEAFYKKITAFSKTPPTNWTWQNYTAMQFIFAALKDTGGDTDPMKLAKATAGRTIDSPFGANGTLTMRESDNTLVGYMVGYSKTISKAPWITDYRDTAWDQILKHESDWMKKQGYA